MLSKTLNYISHHAIAILALICSLLALAGASYAAIKLPRNSVGTTQIKRGAVSSAKLKQGAVTPAKLSGSRFGGYVRAWAQVSSDGKLVASHPRATLFFWTLHGSGTSEITSVLIDWKPRIPRTCIPVASAAANFPQVAQISTTTHVAPQPGFGSQVAVSVSNDAGVYVAIIC